MTAILRMLSYLIIALAYTFAYASQSLSPVKHQGTTLLETADNKMTVQAKIKTHQIEIGKRSDGRPLHVQSNCTYSRYPCSLVDSLEIAVNGNSLFIPRSVFCDLADLYKAELKIGKKCSILMLFGGDASESYIVKIEFNESRVCRRILSSALSPDQSFQETVFHERVLGD